jgi:predicted acyl esterase
LRLSRRPSLLLALAALALAAADPAAGFDLQPGIGLVAVTGAGVGAELVLADATGAELERGVADRFGSFVFRELAQGETYLVRESGDAGGGSSVTVLRFADHPDESLYESQDLVAGYQYIRTRDGTLLAAMVRPPIGRTLEQGPFPTVVEYSGYPAADPNATQASTLLASALGFATVAVNMRGSGCSGGVMDLFDLPTTADGYDVIETVAAQPWVQAGKVGMVGISFPGISQLFVAGARPPHLAAIAPLSVIADIYRAPGYPGGIFNDGFAKSWLQERKDDARPAPEGGQGWAIRRVNQGDATCLANQRLRLQTQDPIEFTRTHDFYEADLMDARSPIRWVSHIEVPIFLAGAWQDEQTGPGFATMLRHLPGGKDVKIRVTNGVHSSALEPELLYEWIAFLDLYVAGRKPTPGRSAPFAPIIAGEILGGGAPTPPLPADPYDGIFSYSDALVFFESSPRVRVLMENGAGSPVPGLPAPTFELGFDRWPPREIEPSTWYFGPEGSLTRRRNRVAGEDEGFDSYAPDPEARPQQTLPGTGQSDSWRVLPAYDWRPLFGDTAVAYATPPLVEDVVIVGPGNVDLWLRSSALDTDLQVTLSEIRPDGLETYVQSGWLRASHRRSHPRLRTRLEPWPTHLEVHAEAMPEGRFARVRVGLEASAHVFRAGSRIRVSIEAPGGDRTRWRFETFDTGGLVRNDVSRTHALPSRLVLPVVPGVDVPPELPPCPGLRGQPCRTYVPASNGG